MMNGMATEQLPIGVDRAAAMLRAVCEASPDATNPRADGRYSACVYTSRDGAGHCAVGQLLVSNDLPCPTWADDCNSTEFDALPERFLASFTDEAVSAIAGWQTAFDRVDDDVTWGEALRRLDDAGLPT